MRYTILSVLAAAASAVSAYTQPVPPGVPTAGHNPTYTPAEDQIVPAGKPFEITWGNNTAGTITIVLLRGDSQNANPLYPIVEKIINDGHYTWTPSTKLVPDVSNYSIQLIEDDSGHFQYSNQFGISNDAVASSSTTSTQASSTTDSPSSYTTSSSTGTTSNIISPSVGSTTSASPSSLLQSTSSTVTSTQTTLASPATTSGKVSSATPETTSTASYSTTSSKPSSTLTTSKPVTTATSSGASPPQQTGAASVTSVKAGITFAIAVVCVVAFTL